MILDAASTLAWIWPAAHRALRKELKRLGEEAPVQTDDGVKSREDVLAERQTQ
jgi:hypothetical protein